MIAEPFCSMCGKATVLIHGRGYVCETPSCPCDKEPAIAPQEATMTATRDHMVNNTVTLLRGSKDLRAIKTVLKGLCEAYAAHCREADQRTIAELRERDAQWVEKWHAAVETGIRNADREAQQAVSAEQDIAAANVSAIEQERDALRAALDLARPQLEYIQITGCPCGAREESTHTHPHVGGCGIDALTKLALAALAGEPEAKLKQLRNGEMVEAKDLEGSDGS